MHLVSHCFSVNSGAKQQSGIKSLDLAQRAQWHPHHPRAEDRAAFALVTVGLEIHNVLPVANKV